MSVLTKTGWCHHFTNKTFLFKGLILLHPKTKVSFCKTLTVLHESNLFTYFLTWKKYISMYLNFIVLKLFYYKNLFNLKLLFHSKMLFKSKLMFNLKLLLTQSCRLTRSCCFLIRTSCRSSCRRRLSSSRFRPLRFFPDSL